MRKRSLKEREEFNLREKKKNADAKWDKIVMLLNEGKTIDWSIVAQSMSECNWADYGLLQRGIKL